MVLQLNPRVMRVTKTKTTTTLYDTNGKQISVVKKEETVTEAPIFLNREDGNAIHQIAETYKEDLKNAKAIKKNLEETRGFIKGSRIFHSMADLIMVVHSSLNRDRAAITFTQAIKTTKDSSSKEVDSVLKAASRDYSTDVKISETLNKKK